MKTVNITIKPSNALDEMSKVNALQQLANSASTEALQFLAEMAQKPNASDKLLKKKGLIKTFF